MCISCLFVMLLLLLLICCWLFLVPLRRSRASRSGPRAASRRARAPQGSLVCVCVCLCIYGLYSLVYLLVFDNCVLPLVLRVLFNQLYSYLWLCCVVYMCYIVGLLV